MGEPKTWFDDVWEVKYRERPLKGQPQSIVVKAFGQEVMSSAIVVANRRVQKVAIFKPFLLKSGRVLELIRLARYLE